MRRVVESIPGYDGPPVMEDPFPAWEYLRKNYPVYYDAVYDNWVVTQYHDVVACLKDNVTFSVQRRPAANSMETIYDGRGILDMDGREHDAHRSTYAADLVGQRLAALRPAIERNAHDLIEAAIRESAEQAARDTID